MKGSLRAGLGLVFLMLLSCTEQESAPNVKESAPVVVGDLRHAILITVDTMRPDRLGAYGYGAADSPNFDALASESIRFENAYAHSSMTAPSFASLLTGDLPSGHMIYDNGGNLEAGSKTMATRLKRAGFSTGAFLGNYALRPSRGFDAGFDVYTQEYNTKEAVRDHPENLAGPITDDAMEWLSDRDPEERLFLWVHYQEPHGPYTPPSFRPISKREALRVLPQNDSDSGLKGIPRYQWLGHGKIAEYESRYDGEVTAFDHHLGRLLEYLEERGILDQSVLIFASDHGEAFGEDGLYFVHGDGLGDAMLRVPLLLRLPNQEGAVREDRVRLIDLLPTLLEAVGVPAGKGRGKSLLRDEGDRPVVAQVRSRRKTWWRSYREGEYEIRQKDGKRAVLYGAEDLRDSIKEKIRTQMARVLKSAAKWNKKESAETPLSKEEEDALRALGYLE